ncbi:F-box kelch-repeat SKIP25-like [Olea europaea subsp. europaea]|uniref:F-box kelch-repeat SKIP25-like n=1 Tax=Olea europaea subsp. europaea TaxID=158383 RepID=A0A8S0PWF1_OLEEU|nr:F-box kelch-repeat SKIP25-like [Olea europaea subsp. europaea]
MNNLVTSNSSSTATDSTTERLNIHCDKAAELHHHQSLLPGLPDHIAQLCLFLVHPSILYSVCRSWRRLIYSPSFPPFLSIYTLLISTQNHANSIEYFSFDPISNKWWSFPPPLTDPSPRFLLRHRSFISRKLPIQSVSVSGNLVLLAATNDKFLPALSRPLIFNPLIKKWTYGPPLSTPRRWCAAGASGDVVYVASGIGSHYNTEVARSVEKWDLKNNNNSHFCHKKLWGFENDWRWERMGGLKQEKFSRDAIDAIGWRGKLCMVNVKGKAAKEGAVYDVQTDIWEEMPKEMLAGWRGPAAAMEEDTIYMVDESKGALRKYDPGRDKWVAMLESEMLKGAQQMAAGGGRVCVVRGDGVSIVVVDVMAPPYRFWIVDTPPGLQAITINILPRLSP